MADYISYARTNYFKVKDFEAFKDAAGYFGTDIITHTPEKEFDEDSEPETLYGLIYDSAHNEYIYVTDLTNEEIYKLFGLIVQRVPEQELGIEVSFTDFIKHHLADGEVAIYMEIGYEKMRYLVGVAIAVHSDGRAIYSNLSDIYEEAQKQFGLDEEPSLAEY